jgi:hypothetical protein
MGGWMAEEEVGVTGDGTGGQTDGQLKKCKTGTWDACVSCMAGRGSAVEVSSVDHFGDHTDHSDPLQSVTDVMGRQRGQG